MQSNKKLKKYAWGDYYGNPWTSKEANTNWGNLANIAGSSIPPPSRIETDYTKSRQNTNTSVNAGVEAVGAINPIIGGALKLGQGIGEQTTDEFGLYKNGTGEFIDNSFNPNTGIQNLKDFSSKPTWSGAANQFSLGLFGTSASQERALKGRDSYYRKQRQGIADYSQGILANYPTMGYAKYGMKYPNGGKLPYPTTVDADYKVLASNIAQYSGNTHENGGIPLDINQDKKPDIEIEDKEVIKDNMVFSDRITPSPEYRMMAKKQGFNITNKDTYASVTAKLGKQKGDFESKLDSTRLGEKRSAELMIERLDDIANSLFEDQQSTTKVNNPKMDYLKSLNNTDPTDAFFNEVKVKRALRGYPEYSEYANGGTLPGLGSFTLGKKNYNYGPSGNLEFTAGYQYPDNYNTTRSNLDQENINLLSDLQTLPNIMSRNTGSLSKEPNIILPSLGNSNINTNIPDIAQNNIGQSNTNNINLRERDLSDYRGDIMAGIGSIANQAIINRMETDFDPNLLQKPQYTYSNRLPYLTKSIDSQFQSAVRGINGSSAQDNNALKANLYAKTLGSLNTAVDSESQRKDIIDSKYSDLVNRTNSINAQLKNQSKMLGLENRNQRLALTQANIDNTIRSYMGNEAQRDASELDFIKSYLQLSKEGNTGVATRLINQLPKRARRRIGFSE